MNIQSYYETIIKPEIETLRSEIDQAILGSDIEDYHKGWRVFFSPIFYQPKVLIMGINPGNGQNGNTDLSFWDDKEMFEYTNPDYSFDLANETKDVFNQAGVLDILKTSTVKTNYYFLTTARESRIYDVISWIGRNYKTKTDNEFLSDKFYRKSAEWSKKLIEIIQPEIIICEGKKAYSNVTDLFPIRGESNWESDCGYTIIPDKNLIILGYSRRYSRMKNKPEFVKLLKSHITI